MTAVYTYTDARQNLASLLDQAASELNISTGDIVQFMAESRRDW